MFPRPRAWDEWRRGFRWRLPPRFNIGTAITDRWAQVEPNRVALVEPQPGGERRTHSFDDLARGSNKLAAALHRAGVRRGERIALLLPQGLETVLVHAASAKLGAVAVPLSLLFGADALEHRLRASGASVLIASGDGWENAKPVLGNLPALRSVFVLDGAAERATDLRRLLHDAPDWFEPVDTAPDDPALMIFTSGTTGAPKGALHGHRVLLGHMPGVEAHHEFMPEPGDLLWTPADWAWAGGLLNVLLPGLFLGVPVVINPPGRFEPERALTLLAEQEVRNAFVPPTALRMMRASGVRPRDFALKLRTMGSAGEALGRDTFEWAEDAFGLRVNEAYGQTECNLVLGSCAALGVSRAGVTGKAIPGHTVAVVDEEGRTLPPGESGTIAVEAPDPVMFLGYWNDEAATRAKFLGRWFMTGDVATTDAEGYFHFKGRDDDIITSSGFRIGPSEIEESLGNHSAVRMAVAIGKPDSVRTEIVKAYVALRDGFSPSDALAAELSRFVRTRLSAHEYPREVEFVADVPLTASGKVIRRVFRDRARDEVSSGAAGS